MNRVPVQAIIDKCSRLEIELNCNSLPINQAYASYRKLHFKKRKQKWLSWFHVSSIKILILGFRSISRAIERNRISSRAGPNIWDKAEYAKNYFVGNTQNLNGSELFSPNGTTGYRSKAKTVTSGWVNLRFAFEMISCYRSTIMRKVLASFCSSYI